MNNGLEKIKVNNVKLAEFLMKDVGILEKWENGYSETIREFWDNFIEPLLPKKETLEKLLDMLIKYCDEPDAVFVIRAFGEKDTEQTEAEDITVKRRGFLTHTDVGLSFFYTDNYITPYFQKMALNDYVPEYEEFKTMMLDGTFPARCSKSAGTKEAIKAVYKIQGERGIDPGYGDANYKISHIFDVGEGYWLEDESRCIGSSDMLGDDKFFPRGKYEDWKIEKGTDRYIRVLPLGESKALLARKWLKAHFLRLVCPLNYIMTPQKDYQRPGVKLRMNDIGEEPKFQSYAMYRFKQKYGEVFERYCSCLMLPPGTMGVDYGDEIIKLEYSLKIGEDVKRERAQKKKNKKFPSEEEFDLIREYLCEPDMMLTKKQLAILTKYGFDNSMKGILTRIPIQDLIISTKSEQMVAILIEIEMDLVF